MLTVQKLREMGYKVRVTHKRVYSHIYDLHNNERRLDLGSRRKFPRFTRTLANQIGLSNIHCRGGETIVEVTTPDNVDAFGVSLCSLKDHYNKKLGVEIALGRAVKALERSGYVIPTS